MQWCSNPISFSGCWPPIDIYMFISISISIYIMHTAPRAETCLCAHNYRFLHKGCRCSYFNPVLQCLKFNTEVTPAESSFCSAGEGPKSAQVRPQFLFCFPLQSLCQATVWLLDVLPQLSATPPCLQIQLLSYCWFSHSFCHSLYNMATNWCS